jgi:hypothetical protein
VAKKDDDDDDNSASSRWGAAVSSVVLDDVTEGLEGGGCEGQVRRFSGLDDRSMT